MSHDEDYLNFLVQAQCGAQCAICKLPIDSDNEEIVMCEDIWNCSSGQSFYMHDHCATRVVRMTSVKHTTYDQPHWDEERQCFIHGEEELAPKVWRICPNCVRPDDEAVAAAEQ